MKLPRMPLRWLMSLVAVVAVVLGAAGWMLRLSAEHRRRAYEYKNIITYKFYIGNRFGSQAAPLSLRDRRNLWADEMRLKYERAADHPWLPVEPDPPEPKD